MPLVAPFLPLLAYLDLIFRVYGSITAIRRVSATAPPGNTNRHRKFLIKFSWSHSHLARVRRWQSGKLIAIIDSSPEQMFLPINLNAGELL